MADNTTLSAAVGSGDVIITEDTGTGKLAVSGIVTGAHGVNGGRVTVTNPLFVGLTDGTAAVGVLARPLRVDPTGTTTQPVSMASVPLPTGAAQDATLTGGSAKVQVTDGASHTLPAGDAIARSIQIQINDGTAVLGTSGRPVKTDPTGTTTQPVSMAAAPAGAALDATLTGGSAKTQVIYPASTYYTALAAVSGAAKASPGNLKSLKAINRNTSSRYLQLFNSATAPAGGASALDEFLVPAGAMIGVGTDFFTDAGVNFSAGIAWGFSSTSGTYTAATAADCDFSAVLV